MNRMKAPGTLLLKLGHDKLLSTFAFKFNLRRCIKDLKDAVATKNMENAELQSSMGGATGGGGGGGGANGALAALDDPELDPRQGGY